MESNYDEIDYMNQETDIDIIRHFCSITNSTKNTAISFLKKADWNVTFAVEKYYSVNEIIDIDDTIDANKVDTDVQGAVYNHGIAFWYWTSNQIAKRVVKMRFTNLKEEILHFKRFTSEYWQDLIEECNILIQTDKIKNLCSNGNNTDIYDIKDDSSITVEHLCALKLYTDFDWLCKIFCEAFRMKKIFDNQYERIQSVQRRNEKIANWAKLLVECVQCYGQFITGEKNYYRGISMEFLFKRFITRFNAPLSTTTSFAIAVTFAHDDCGIIIELNRYNEYISGFDCSIASRFDEKEILFFGSDSIFRISSIYQLFDDVWMSYRSYIDGIQNIINIANGSIQWNRANNMKDIIGYILPDLYIDKTHLPQYIESLLNYHLVHITNKIEYDFGEMTHQYQWVKDIFVRDDRIPNVSNACNIFKNCKCVTFLMPSDVILNAKDCKTIINDLPNINSNNITIQFQWVSSQPTEDIAGIYHVCDAVTKSVILQARVDISANCITISPSKMNILVMSSNIQQSVSKTKKSKSNIEQKGMKIVFDFIVIFSEIHKTQNSSEFSSIIPDAILFMIYQYVEQPLSETEVKSNISYTKKDIISHIQGVHTMINRDVLTAVLCHPQTQILHESTMEISGFINKQKLAVVAVLTAERLYFVHCIRNYSIWLQFQNNSNINHFVSGWDTKIRPVTADKIARAFVDAKIVSNSNMVSWLVGKTKKLIFLSILFAKTSIPSLNALFELSVTNVKPAILAIRKQKSSDTLILKVMYALFTVKYMAPLNEHEAVDIRKFDRITKLVSGSIIGMADVRGVKLFLTLHVRWKKNRDEWIYHIDKFNNVGHKHMVITSIYQSGFMQKEGAIFKSWRRRYFKLYETGIVAYYKHSSDLEAIGKFDSTKYTKIECISWGKSKIYGIQLCTPERDWKFACENDEQRQEWVKAFEKVRNEL